MKKRILSLAVVGALAAALLSGCDWGNHSSDNSPSVQQPTGPATLIKFPYGFRNVTAKCDGPNMVYSGSAGVDDSLPPSIAVVANDPRCTGH